jgi:hypothetical protein
MKSYLFAIILAILVIPFAGCKKESFDPTAKSQGDFIGTWKGVISTFKDNKLLKEYGTVVIYQDASGTMLTGILFMSETNVFHEFQFVDGTLYFNVENNDPENPFCQNWSLGGYAVFTAEDEIEISIAGNECGQVGDEFINWEGTLQSVTDSPDSVKYFNFGTTGNLWNYKVLLKNGDTCQLSKQIITAAPNYVCSGFTGQNCFGNGQNLAFEWSVSPSVFLVQKDSTVCNNPVSFPINAKYGVTYNSLVNSDTVSVTLVDTNYYLVTPGGSFTCIRFMYTEPVYYGSLKIKRSAYLWLNNRYGIIRQEVINPVGATDIRVMELSSKGF